MAKRAGTLHKLKANLHSPSDLWLLLRILMLVTLLPAVSRTVSMPVLLRLLTPSATKSSPPPMETKFLQRLVRLTDYLLERNVWIYRPNCLWRSLVLYHFLAKAGVAIQICFGVKLHHLASGKSLDNALEGHAWLVYQGVPFQEPHQEGIKGYTLTYRFPD